MGISRNYYAEYVGTFTLVFAGTGALVINAISGDITHVGVSLTFGLVVLSLIYTVGEISGAHLNPAVTIGFWIAKKFPIRLVLGYIASQLLGAISASILLKILFPSDRTLGATIPAGSNLQSVVLEFILTWFLMLVILSVSTGAKEKGATAGIAVGSVVCLEALFAGPISGASMNPARSIAPALVSQNLGSLWIYILAPLIGAGFGVGTFRVLTERGIKQNETKNLDSVYR